MDDQFSQSRERQQVPPVRPLQPQQPSSQSPMPPPPAAPPTPTPATPIPTSPAQKKISKKKLFFWFILLSAISAAGAYYFTRNYVIQPDQPPVATATVVPTAFLSPTIAHILPEEWYPYEAPEYNMAFAYPRNWGRAESVQITPALSGIEVQSQLVTFLPETQVSNGQSDMVMLSTYPTGEASELNRLKTIFQEKKVDKDSPIWLPIENAGMTYASPVRYIENTNATLRGLVYFARTAEPEEKPYLNTLLVILTDGGENIVQFSHLFTTADEEKSQYPVVYGECKQLQRNAIYPECRVNKEVFENFATYQEIASKAAVVH